MSSADPAARPPVVGVLALQGNVREHVRMLEALGVEVLLVRRPEELERVDGLVLPGGESTTMAKLARTFDLLEPLRQATKAGLPMFGTCAGMILLADRIEDGAAGQETIGGLDVVVRRNAFGRQVDSFEADLVLAPGDQADDGAEDAEEDSAHPFHAVFIRAPWVERVGPEVEVVATVAAGPEAGRVVAVRQGRILATSFHPEMTGDDRVHAQFVELVRR